MGAAARPDLAGAQRALDGICHHQPQPASQHAGRQEGQHQLEVQQVLGQVLQGRGVVRALRPASALERGQRGKSGLRGVRRFGVSRARVRVLHAPAPLPHIHHTLLTLSVATTVCTRVKWASPGGGVSGSSRTWVHEKRAAERSRRHVSASARRSAGGANLTTRSIARSGRASRSETGGASAILQGCRGGRVCRGVAHCACRVVL